MSEIGKVIEADATMLTVSLTRREACANCRACTVGLQEKQMLIRAKNECGAVVSDFVEVELKEGIFIKAVAIMFGLPLIMLIIGFFVGSALAANFVANAYAEMAGFVTGASFMLLGYAVIKKNDNLSKYKSYEPSAVAITEKPNSIMP